MNQRDRQVLGLLFAIDTRALAALRIGLGLLLIFQGLTSHLGVGVEGEPWGWVVHFSWLVAVPFAVMLVLGYMTRWAVIGSWLFLAIPVREALLTGVSVPLQHYTLLLFLFWMMFLPLNGHLSLDARHEVPVERGQILSVASAGLLIQIFLIYLFAGVTKNLGEWFVEASALETLMANPTYATALGEWAGRFPALLSLGSRLTVILEIAGSLLLFVPLRGIQARRVVLVSAFILFHVGMGALMNLRTFPLVMIVVWTAFLPGAFWDRVTRAHPTELLVDSTPSKTIVASVALSYILVSNLVTWLYYPATGGWPAVWQEVGRHLVLYQQWAMFSLPSSL